MMLKQLKNRTMKTSALLPLFLLLVSFTPKPPKNKGVLIYKSEKGMVTMDKDFLKVDFDIDYYYKGEGNHVVMLVFSDKKNYLGDVDERTYFTSKDKIVAQYQEELQKKFNMYNYSDKILRMEKKNNRFYFFYYEQFIELEIGRIMKSGTRCVGAHKSELQLREKNFIVAIYLDGKCKYAEKFTRNSNYDILSRTDFSSDYRKSSL
jgi:hypothetical protein